MQDADVIVVGAGFAGLAATRAIADAGLRPLVLEARDRVGGRVETQLVEGATIDLGGQWLGPTQERALALVDELGLETYRQHVAGKNVLDLDGRRRTFSGTVPRVSPLAFGLDRLGVVAAGPAGQAGFAGASLGHAGRCRARRRHLGIVHRCEHLVQDR